MLETLARLIESKKWDEARPLADSLRGRGEVSDTFWILNAAICIAEEDSESEYACIANGLEQNPSNYELYFMLGNYYLQRNPSQAFLCYEQALFYCESEPDGQLIRSRMDTVNHSVNAVSIIIPSQNNDERLQACLTSVRSTVPEHSCEIIVTDCGPKKENFIRVRNNGIKSSAPNNDILLLNSDTLLPPNALFWLRMGLYERPTVGAAGPLSSNGDYRQTVDSPCRGEDDITLAGKIHLPSRHPYENKIYLSGFALLIRRQALDETGLFDTKYGNPYFSDCDFGMKLTRAGYELLLCHNSFVPFDDCLDYTQGLNNPLQHNERFYEKWGFQITYYYSARDELIRFLDCRHDDEICVLEVGCGCGTTLSKIKYLYPNAVVHGIELEEDIAKMGTYLGNIISGNIEASELPYEFETFDYILFGDVLEHLRNPDETLIRMKKYLKPSGKLIASIPNLMHISVILQLLTGRFTYTDSGLLDRTHIHFFTQYEITEMFKRCGYRILQMQRFTNTDFISKAGLELADALYRLPYVESREQFETYQYYLAAQPL